MNLNEVLKNGIPKGRIVHICSANRNREFLDIIRKTSQTTRNESIAWFCYEDLTTTTANGEKK